MKKFVEKKHAFDDHTHIDFYQLLYIYHKG